MSPLYDDPQKKMEDVFGYMWKHDTSGIFDFNSEVLLDLEQQNVQLRVFVSSTVVKNEMEFGTEPFS